MRKTIWSIFLGACAMLFLSVACDRTPTSLHEELNEEMSEETITFIRKRSGVEEVSRAKRNANSIEESPYSCLVSTLNGDDAEYNYDNRSFWLHFPEAAIKEANGNTVFKALTFTDKHAGSRAGHWNGVDDVVRVAQCVIPDSELAERLLENELKKFGKGTWLESRMKSPNQLNMVQSVTSGGEWVCVREMTIFICEADPDTGELIHCVQYVHSPVCIEYAYVEEDDPGSGGGPGDPSDDPGFCDPMGIEPCFDDGGSSVPPPEPDPCDDENPPAYCENPCETNDPILDDIGIQMTLETLWDDSKTNLPIDQRLEQGGFIVQNGNNELEFVLFPEDWTRSACGISIPENFLNSVPSNTIGVVHTHPFFEGEDTTSPNVCGADGSSNYQSGTNLDDIDFVAQISNHLSNFSIKGYVIDGNNIVSITSWGALTFNNRCGY